MKVRFWGAATHRPGGLPHAAVRMARAAEGCRADLDEAVAAFRERFPTADIRVVPPASADLFGQPRGGMITFRPRRAPAPARLLAYSEADAP